RFGANAVAQRKRARAALEARGEHRPQAPRKAHDVEPGGGAHCLARKQLAVETPLRRRHFPFGARRERALRALRHFERLQPLVARPAQAQRGPGALQAKVGRVVVDGVEAALSRRGGKGQQARHAHRGLGVETKLQLAFKLHGGIWGDRWDSNPQQPESQSGTLPLSYGHRSRYYAYLSPPTGAWSGLPGATRTRNLRLRRPLLYPVELRAASGRPNLAKYPRSRQRSAGRGGEI